MEWILKLVDRVTAPARRMVAAADALERRLGRVNDRSERLAQSYVGAGRAAERSAAMMDRAYARPENRLLRMWRTTVAFTRATAQVGVAAGLAGGAALTRAAIGGMSQREGSLESLGTLLKTQDAAQVRSAASFVGRFADVTPFEDPDVMGSVRQLLAAQFSFEQTKGIARITGDAASAMGSDVADAAFKWQVIIRALGQIKAKGRVQGDELLQLQEAGIGTDKYLKKYAGPDYRKLMERGQLSADQGLSAILAGLDEEFEGSMERMSRTYSGLMSTLASRPKRIFGAMFDQGALDAPKRVLQNLVEMTDFSRPPGSLALDRMAALGQRLMDVLFRPLDSVTGGNRGAAAIDALLDRLEAFVGWMERTAPTVQAMLGGMVGGFQMMWRVARFILRPLERFLRMLGLIGEDDSQGLARVVGYLLAGAVALKLFGMGLMFLLGPTPFIITLFGGLLLLSRALPMLAASGVISAAAMGRMQLVLSKLIPAVRIFAILTGGVHGVLLGLGVAAGKVWSMFLMPLLAGVSRFVRVLRTGGGVLGALRAGLAFAARFGWIARLLSGGGRLIAVFAGLSNPIGWIITGLLTVKEVGDAIYDRFSGFANLIDDIKGKLSWVLKPADQQDTVLGRALAFDPLQWIQGKPQAWEQANANFAQGVQGVAGRLGVKAGDLLKVMAFESGLNPAARNKQSGASGLIQFMPDTARELGTTVEALRGMSREQQLPYIERYLRARGVKPGADLEQLYMSVLAGNANTRGELWRQGSIQYTQNSGLDSDKDGVITSTEAVQAVERRWQTDGPKLMQTLNITVQGTPDPAAVAAIQGAAYNGTLNALGQVATEGGWSPGGK
ncbi:tape measure protein [Deinococcus petrolearius]|uniref:Tape measure protein n=1 Tax=Deinococcus petrolearius TaxID=1751295 RepID=A0ABW1DDX4_9DEIO